MKRSHIDSYPRTLYGGCRSFWLRRFSCAASTVCLGKRASEVSCWPSCAPPRWRMPTCTRWRRWWRSLRMALRGVWGGEGVLILAPPHR